MTHPFQRPLWRRLGPSTMGRVTLAVAVFLLALTMMLSLPWTLGKPDSFVAGTGHHINRGAPLTIEEATALDYTPHQGYLAFSNTPHEVWLRVDIKPSAEPLALRIQPPYIESVSVFQPLEGGQWDVAKGGSAGVYSQRPTDGVNLVVPLRENTDTVYLRVKTITSGVLVEAVPLNEATRFERHYLFVSGIYQGMLVMLLLIPILAHLVTRDPLWLASFFLDLAAGLYNANQMALFQRFLFPDTPDLGNQLHILFNASMLVSYAFFWPRFFRLFSLPRWMSWPFYLVAPLSVLWLAFWVTGQTHLILLTCNIMYLIIVALGFPAILLSRHENIWLLNTYRMLSLVQIVLPTYWIAGSLFGFQLSPAVMVYALAPSNLFLAFFIILILAFHTHRTLQERVQLRIDKAEAELQLDMERDSRLEATGFLSLVIHEVKSPLNHIRLAINNLLYDLEPSDPRAGRLQRVNVSVTAINDILERTLELDAAAAGRLPIHRQPVDLVELVMWTLPQVSLRNRVDLQLPKKTMVETDAQLMGLMVKNLIDNALQHSPPNSKIQVRMWVEEEGRAADPEESVSGFPPSARTILAITNKVGPQGYPDLTRLFGKSYHGASVGQHTGLGLGLFWVSEVAKRLQVDLRYRIVEQEIEFSLCFHHSP